MPVGSMFICKPLCRGYLGNSEIKIISGREAMRRPYFSFLPLPPTLLSKAVQGAVRFNSEPFSDYVITEFRKILLLLFDLNYGISENTVVAL